MRKITATGIISSDLGIVKNEYIEVNKTGEIVTIANYDNEISCLEYHNGLLIPGFVLIDKLSKENIRNLSESNSPFDNFLYNKGLQVTNIKQGQNKQIVMSDFYNKICNKPIKYIIENFILAPLNNIGVKDFGIFEIGKSTGILLLHGFDFRTKQTTSEVLIERLV